MKTFISILIFCFLGFVSDSFSSPKAEKNDHYGGRCTGSSSCTACSNCSGCAHCKSGGTCGVCSGSFSGKKTSTRSSKKEKSKGKSDRSKAPKVFIEDINVNFNSNKTIIANHSITIFEKPSFKSKIIETVSKKTQLINLSKNGSWYKVKVQRSGKTGYVNSNDIQ
ncbi:SH3 domain-containing protein [Chryseobacterium sp. NRRL B-14859]|uniref:SH3 domain-containing protein n=1 Tax=unclassified Chryseobacterium TaxID=2593645 RepID=UPI003341A7E7